MSKAALEALASTYAAETAKTPLRVNLLNPGPMQTRMRAQAMPGEDPETLPPPEAVAAAALSLVDPELKDTGRIFDFEQGTIRPRAG